MKISTKVRGLHERLIRRMNERRPDRYSPDGPYNDHRGPFVQGEGWMEEVAAEFEDELWNLTADEKRQFRALDGGR